MRVYHSKTMNPRSIRFLHRGAVVEVEPASTTRTVLEWLREDARCTGTKEGCNEGDCGACTVVVAELAPAGCAAEDVVAGLRLRSANACLQFLPTLDGKALFTVEDLRAASGELHPVQRAMVECHASQCGFCTPGFVMSLWATYQHHVAHGRRPSRQRIADELSGNLCRCTGYRPIVDAGERMFDLPAAALDAAPVVAALRALADQPALRSLDAHGAELAAPRTLDEFAAARLAHPNARILAGSTDIGLWVNKMFRELPSLLYIGGVEELRQVEVRGGVLSIGAAATLEDAWRALVERWPTLRDIWLRFAGVPLRHTGTMGGNVANGSPIGDSAPVLMALDAALVLRRGGSLRRVPLAGFYTGYMQSVLRPGEFVQAIEVPMDATSADVRAYKISKRFDCDISAVCAGLAIERDAADVVVAARLAFGGMAATVQRAAHAEAALIGARWDEAALVAAQAALTRDFKPLTDMRASAAYRMQVAQNLLRRFWLETRADAPLGAEQTSVWAAASASPPAPAMPVLP
jgi:xanthine dehydrogenase small subunit